MFATAASVKYTLHVANFFFYTKTEQCASVRKRNGIMESCSCEGSRIGSAALFDVAILERQEAELGAHGVKRQAYTREERRALSFVVLILGTPAYDESVLRDARVLPPNFPLLEERRRRVRQVCTPR